MTIKEFEIQLALGTLSYDIKYKLVRNERTSKEILTKLSTAKNNYIRYWVAVNHSTPTEVLIKLSKDKDWSVRYGVAYNPNTPVEVLVKLSTDEHYSVSNKAKNREGKQKRRSANG